MTLLKAWGPIWSNLDRIAAVAADSHVREGCTYGKGCRQYDKRGDTQQADHRRALKLADQHLVNVSVQQQSTAK